MPAAVTFDTLGYFEKLKAAGFSETQAKVQTELWRELVEDKLITKQDLEDLHTGLRVELKELEYRLTIRLGLMLAAAVTIQAALIKLL